MNNLIKVIVVATLTLLLCPQRLEAQSNALPQDGNPQSYKVISKETYERVLNTVFPRDGEGRGYDFILRFEPSFAPESQIIIRSTANKVEMLEYTSLSGNIYKKLNSVVAQGGKEDVVAMAKLIQVRKRLIDVPIAQSKKWRRSLVDSFDSSMKILEQRNNEAARGVGTITLDGTFYNFWYDQAGSHISFNILDEEVSDYEVTGILKLVQWMNSVRMDVAKLK